MFCPNAVTWGDVGTWVAAIGTVTAVFVALGVFIYDYFRRRKEDRRKQAELITGWIRHSPQRRRK